MKKIYDQFKNPKNIIVLFVFIIGWILLLIQHLQVGMYFDDFGNASLSYGYAVPGVMGTKFSQKQILEWAHWIYSNWSGRILYACLFLIPLLRNGIKAFMIIQSIILIIILFIVYKIACKICNKNDSVLASVLVLILYMLIDITFHNHGTYWASASVLYIWPLLPFLVSVCYYDNIVNKKKKNKKYNQFCFFAFEGISIIFTTLSQEQLGGALIVFFLCYVLLHHINEIREYLKIDIFVIGTSIISYSLLIFAPGNTVRLNDSNEFAMLSVFGKVKYSLPSILNVFISRSFVWINFMLLIANLFLTIVLIKNKKRGANWYLCLISGMLLPVYWWGSARHFPLLLMHYLYLFILIYIAIILFLYLKQINKLQYFALFIAAVASVFCLCFSPYIVQRSFLGYIIICFSYIMVSFMAIRDIMQWRVVSYVVTAVIGIVGLKNYIEIAKGYYVNSFYTSYNINKLINWKDANYIILYNYPENYSLYRSIMMNDGLDSDSVVTGWVKRYYGIRDDVVFIWKDLDENIDNSVIYEFGNGFYDQENDGKHTWNWAENKASIKFYNLYSEDKEVKIHLSLSAPDQVDGVVELNINGKAYNIDIKKGQGEKNIYLMMPIGVTYCDICTDLPQIQSVNDSRRMYYKVEQISLQVEE